GGRRLGRLLAGRLARCPFRVHGRRHRRWPPNPHPLARGRVEARMAEELWAEVDRFVGATIAPDDDALQHAGERCEAAGLPAIQASRPQGNLLTLLARSIGARAVLEFGTLGGYSTIWLGRALPADASLITLEADDGHAEVASENIAEAGLDALVD